jgi:hypothetical protein
MGLAAFMASDTFKTKTRRPAGGRICGLRMEAGVCTAISKAGSTRCWRDHAPTMGIIQTDEAIRHVLSTSECGDEGAPHVAGLMFFCSRGFADQSSDGPDPRAKSGGQIPAGKLRFAGDPSLFEAGLGRS